MQLPFFNGAHFLYHKILEPFFLKHEKVIEDEDYQSDVVPHYVTERPLVLSWLVRRLELTRLVTKIVVDFSFAWCLKVPALDTTN